ASGCGTRSRRRRRSDHRSGGRVKSPRTPRNTRSIRRGMPSGSPALRRLAPLALLAALSLAGCAAPREEGLGPGAKPGVTTSLNAHVPSFARWPYEPFSRQAAVQIALREWRAFGQQVLFPNVELPVDWQRQEGMWQRVGEYWWLGLDPRWMSQAWTGIHNENGQVFPESQDGNYAWSAAFISYV